MAQTSPQMRLETVEPPHLSVSPGRHVQIPSRPPFLPRQLGGYEMYEKYFPYARVRKARESRITNASTVYGMYGSYREPVHIVRYGMYEKALTVHIVHIVRGHLAITP